MSILRLWSFYHLDLQDVFEGKVLTSVSHALTDMDVFTIARLADNREMYYEAIIWLRGLLTRINRKGDDETVTKSAVVRALASAYFKVNGPFSKYVPFQKTLILER